MEKPRNGTPGKGRAGARGQTAAGNPGGAPAGKAEEMQGNSHTPSHPGEPSRPSYPGEPSREDWIGRQLRRVYDEAATEPLPDDLRALLDQLDQPRQEKPGS